MSISINHCLTAPGHTFNKWLTKIIKNDSDSIFFAISQSDSLQSLYATMLPFSNSENCLLDVNKGLIRNSDIKSKKRKFEEISYFFNISENFLKKIIT